MTLYLRNLSVYGNIGRNPPGRLRLSNQDQSLEQIWDALLSRKQERISRVFLSLDLTSRESVLHHLQKMAGEAGWHPEQVRSALAALKVITRLDKENT